MKKSIIYTRTGDSGMTSLVGGTRASKNSARLEAYGTIDELNSHIGLCAAQAPDPLTGPMFAWIQHRLFDIGSYLACDPQGDFVLPPGADDETVGRLETMIDTIDSRLPRINRFVLPGGSLGAAQAHVARTVCRRAERRILALSAEAPVSPQVLRFINRLSDFLFVVARFNNVNHNIDEIFWQKDC